jgi:hypothetical protein
MTPVNVTVLPVGVNACVLMSIPLWLLRK